MDPHNGSDNEEADTPAPSPYRAPDEMTPVRSTDPSRGSQSQGSEGSYSQRSLYDGALGTPIDASQILVMATPRTPVGLRTPSSRQPGTPSIGVSQFSQFSQGQGRLSTPLSSIPRGDLGRLRTSHFPPMGGTPSSVPGTPSSVMSPRASTGDDESVVSPVRQLDQDEGGTQLAEGVTIWGTNINMETCIEVFRNFLREFTLAEDFEPFYMKRLHVIHRTERFVLNLNCSHLAEFLGSRRFYRQLKAYPQEIIPIMDIVVNEEYSRLFGNEFNQKIQVRTFALREVERMRDLDPSHIDQLLTIRGMVIRCSSIIPDCKMAFFRCIMCHHTMDVLIDRGRIDEPSTCPECKRVGSMELVHNRCMFSDKQLIRLQETPDEIPEGETPHTVTLFAFDDLVDSVRPGDRIEVTGVFRAVPARPNPRMRTMRALYRTYVDTVHFRRTGQNDDTMVAMGEDAQTDTAEGAEGALESGQVVAKKFTPEQIVQFEAFAREGNVYDRLIQSIAPSIWELDDVKKGVLCQLFGGTMQSQLKNLSNENSNNSDDSRESDGGAPSTDGANGHPPKKDATSSHQRGDINILLCGDPGTSKSQLLTYVHKLTPRGIYTSGKGSSAVGLTASVVRDPETRSLVLESGALVLSDNGICCIDEFDKMNDATRSILHEAMEQQTVSITKAGILATLNARTSILASANPVESRYNARLSVVENIKLPPTLLSRFDLIYLILDNPNADSDRRLAKHLVSLYYPVDGTGTGPDATRYTDVVSQDFLKEYIQYSRHLVAPVITEAAVETLVQGYLAMRALGGRGSKTITATPRQLESLIRLSQANAKMRLSRDVLESDVLEAIRLMKVATQAAATDPRTGTIDMDMITTGRTALDRDLVLRLTEELRSMLSKKKGQRLTVGQIRQIMVKEAGEASGEGPGMMSSVTVADLAEAVRELEAEQFLQFTEATQTVLVRSSGATAL